MGYMPQRCLWCWMQSIPDAAPPIPLPNGHLH